MKPRKLSRREFTRAIKNGLGSAVLYIKEYGDKEVQDILLQACTKNYIYDHQLDQNRSSWLYQMLIITGNAATYAEHIKNILTNPADIETSKDLEQLIELASYLFEYGYYEFKPLILTLIDYPHTTVSAATLAEALTNMYSFPGFIMGARLLQKTMKNRELESWRRHALFEYACKTLDSEEETKTKEILAEKSKTDSLIAQYWQELQNYIAEQEKPREPSRHSSPQITLEEALAIIADENSTGKPENRLRKFGYAATESDRQVVMTLMEEETCPKKLANMLQVFQNHPMPFIPRQVEPLIFSNDKYIRLNARNSLQLLKHPQVRTLAIKALKSQKQSHIVTGLDLLTRNYQEQDITLIKRILPLLKNRTETNWAIMAILDIAEESDQAELKEVLLWAFNHNPCGICKQRSLDLLLKRGQAPEQLLFEAQWDVDERVNLLAREAIQPKLC